MDTSSEVRDLARQLLALEAASKLASDAPMDEAVRVCEKLRISLTRFAGADGFTSLLRRALTLARADVPALRTVVLKPDGLLEGLELIAVDKSNGGSEAAIAITAHLLGLLIVFIGKPLTLRLMRDAWPDASWDESNSESRPI